MGEVIEGSGNIEIYRIVVEEEYRNLQIHQTRLAFLVSILTAALGGTILGLFNAERTLELLALLLGPILTGVLCCLGKEMSTQFYERFLDAVTFRAKLEQRFGMTEPPESPDVEPSAGQSGAGHYWQGEALIPTRNLESRRDPERMKYLEKGRTLTGSQAWCKHLLNRGYNRLFCQLMTVGQVLSVTLLGLIVAKIVRES